MRQRHGSSLLIRKRRCIPCDPASFSTDMADLTLRVLLIGDVARPEFHEAVAAVEELASVTRFPDVQTAIAALNGDGPAVGNALRGVPPDTDGFPSWNATEGVPYRRIATEGNPYSRETGLKGSNENLRLVHAILLLQAYPDQFPSATVDRLRGLSALGAAHRGTGKLVRRRAAQRPPPTRRDTHVLASGSLSHSAGISPLAPSRGFCLAVAGHRKRRRTAAGHD